MSDVPIAVWMEELRRTVDAELDARLPRLDEPPGRLHEAMRYSVFAGGKRLRPILAILAHRVPGGTDDDVLALASAIEMVHTYSLIHDDLPAMDDDDLRRGKPTNHRVFGEATAILAGDALLTRAFAQLAEIPAPDAVVRRAVAILGAATGSHGMVGGQMADLAAEGKRIDLPAVEYIHSHKTGALIQASVRLGAVHGRASAEVESQLAAYGARLGLAFQVIDDVLDESGTESGMGKAVHKDRERGKATYPSVIGVEESRALARRLVDEATASLAGLPGAEPLVAIARLVVDRDR